MIPTSIRLKTENFRAINKADIIINGITVVAGENSCGKSSLSKLLYFLYKTVSNYDYLVKDKLYSSLRDVIRFLEIIEQELRSHIKDRSLRDEFRRESSDLKKNLHNSEYIEDELESWLTLVNKIEDIYNSSAAKPLSLNNTSVRFKYIIRDILKTEDPESDISASFVKIKSLIRSRFKKAAEKIKSRPTSLFIEELKSVFSGGDLPKKFEVLEYDDLIVSFDRNHLSIPYSIQNAIYIDTPMMLSIDDSTNIHWSDLNELLLQKGTFTNIIPFTQLISKEIINGDAVVEEGVYSEDEFLFKRSDGAVFNLLDVATGIKSFSILQILLKNGSLTDKTLLIIDEPESNLHPQWIVEYARVIVMLNKIVGIKFFLATHNPDMVSAIRYISEKEGTLSDVNFYLAEKSEELFKYNYKFLDKEIDPIFESFNIAIERINKYGI